MSLNHTHSPKINPTEQTPQSGLHHHENSYLAESAYITSEYQKTAQTPTTHGIGYESHVKIESSSPHQHVDSSRFSTDDKNSYSAYSTTGLASNLGSAALNYQYTSKDYTLPSTYGTSTSYSYQPSAKIEEYNKSLGNPEQATQSYSYSSYKRESTSPTIKALNENTASLLGRSAAIENNFGKTSLTLQERYGLTPALSFGVNNHSADLGNLGLAKEEHKTSDNLKYSDYLKSKHTVQSFEYGKSPYEQTFGSTAGLAGEDVKRSGLQQQSKGLYSSTDYTDLINKISSKAEPKNDSYTILKPDSLTNTEKKQRQTVGSHYYQSTYPNTVRTPSESGRKERDRYANSELSAAASPPFRRDKLEVSSHHQEVVDDYVISDPHVTKKTLYTIENSGSTSINGGKDFVNQLGLHKTPERRIKTKSGSPSPFDDLKHALKNESIQISKIVIETVENYGGEAEAHEAHHNRHANEKFDIVMEQGAVHNRGHSRTGSIKSPTNNVKIQRKLIDDSSSFKDPVHHHHYHSRKASDTSSSKVEGTISAINDRIKDLDHQLNQGVRSSASKYQSLISSNSKAESGIHHRTTTTHHHHHEEKSAAELKAKEKEDEKLRAIIEKENEKERQQQEKEREKQEKERQKQEKERQKKEQEEAKAKAKQAAAAAKESNKHHNHNNNGQFFVKLIIVFIVLLLLGVLSLELFMGAEEYDALLDTPLEQVLPSALPNVLPN